MDPPLRRKTNFYFYRVLEGLDPQLEGSKQPSEKLGEQRNFRGLRVWTFPYGGKQIFIFTVFLDGLDPEVEGFKPPNGKFWVQSDFKGLKVWTPPYHTEENKFQFCTGFWTVSTPNWFQPFSGKFWAQPNFRGLKVWTPHIEGGKQISVLYRVLDGLDSQLEGFKPSQLEILGPTQFQGSEVWMSKG